MIIAIDRIAFNYLYKYDEVKIGLHNILDISTDGDLPRSKSDEYIELFNRALPLFEEDHEVFLLIVKKEELEFNFPIKLRYKSVIKVLPLTSLAQRMLFGKLNENIQLSDPMFDTLIEEVKLKRNLENRLLATRKLHVAFKVKTRIVKNDFNIIAEATRNNLKTNTQGPTSFVEELLAFNLTPSYIPQGNIEFLLKSAMVAIRSKGRDAETIKNGPLYLQSKNKWDHINAGSFAESLNRFRNIDDDSFKKSMNAMEAEISKTNIGIDLFKVSYYFLAFRNYLIKNDYNVLGIGSEINALVSENGILASWVLTLLGHSFSLDHLYESLHKLDPALLYKKGATEYRKPDPTTESVIKDSGFKQDIARTGARYIEADQNYVSTDGKGKKSNPIDIDKDNIHSQTDKTQAIFPDAGNPAEPISNTHEDVMQATGPESDTDLAASKVQALRSVKIEEDLSTDTKEVREVNQVSKSDLSDHKSPSASVENVDNEENRGIYPESQADHATLEAVKDANTDCVEKAEIHPGVDNNIVTPAGDGALIVNTDKTESLEANPRIHPRIESFEKKGEVKDAEGEVSRELYEGVDEIQAPELSPPLAHDRVKVQRLIMHVAQQLSKKDRTAFEKFMGKNSDIKGTMSVKEIREIASLQEKFFDEDVKNSLDEFFKDKDNYRI